MAVPLTVKTSLEIRVSWYVTEAESVPSYVFAEGEMLIVTDRGVISAVVVGAPEIVRV